jgi:hypothetical protein
MKLGDEAAVADDADAVSQIRLQIESASADEGHDLPLFIDEREFSALGALRRLAAARPPHRASGVRLRQWRSGTPWGRWPPADGMLDRCKTVELARHLTVAFDTAVPGPELLGLVERPTRAAGGSETTIRDVAIPLAIVAMVRNRRT